MRYLGGKDKFGHVIARECERWRAPSCPIVDMCCGGLNVSRHFKAPRIALDACRPLVTMWVEAIKGWTPPRFVSEELYAKIKRAPDPDDPLTAFVMFGCSYGGKWGAGYARGKGRNFADEARRGVIEKARACRDLVVECCDYRALPSYPIGSVIYCDPPYEGTTGYAGVPPFNHDEFWSHATRWALSGLSVLVSEGDAGRVRDGWVIFREWYARPQLSHADKTNRNMRVERLLVHESSAMAAHPSAFFKLGKGTA